METYILKNISLIIKCSICNRHYTITPKSERLIWICPECGKYADKECQRYWKKREY